MLFELSVATPMVLGSVLFHGLGLQGLARLLGLDATRHYEFGMMSLRGLGLTTGAALGLLLLHGVEIWAYAVLFHLTDAVPGMRDAVYFSTITFGAIGYGDAPIAESWKLVAGIEGINGVILIGWSVAFFVTVMDRLATHHRKERAPPG